MSHAVIRRVVVIDDGDIAQALRNDELSQDELHDYTDDGSPVTYSLSLDADVDATFLCAALGIERGEESALADSDFVVMSWDPTEVVDLLQEFHARLRDPQQLAASLIAHAGQDSELDDCDVSEVVDVLEKVDKGYEPAADAHPAVASAALLVRHVLALRVAKRHEAWVASL